jgi:hypothetical protein
LKLEADGIVQVARSARPAVEHDEGIRIAKAEGIAGIARVADRCRRETDGLRIGHVAVESHATEECRGLAPAVLLEVRREAQDRPVGRALQLAYDVRARERRARIHVAPLLVGQEPGMRARRFRKPLHLRIGADAEGLPGRRRELDVGEVVVVGKAERRPARQRAKEIHPARGIRRHRHRIRLGAVGLRPGAVVFETLPAAGGRVARLRLQMDERRSLCGEA